MKPNRRPIRHAVVEAAESALAAEGAGVATTIRVTHANHGNRAGSVLVNCGVRERSFSSLPFEFRNMTVAQSQPLLPNFDNWRLGCQDEVDQALPNARRNTRASKNSATRPNAAANAKLKNR